MALDGSKLWTKSKRVHRVASSLSPKEWRLALRAWLMLMRTSVVLRLRPALRNTNGFLRQRGARLPEVANVWDLIECIDRAVRIASHGFPRRPRCLVRSLSMGKLMADLGIFATLRIGVRRAVDRFEAHAWLEFEGRPIGEPVDIGSSYSPLEPGASAP